MYRGWALGAAVVLVGTVGAAAGRASFVAQSVPPPVTVLRPARVFDGVEMHEGWGVRVRGDRIDASARPPRLPSPALAPSTCPTPR